LYKNGGCKREQAKAWLRFLFYKSRGITVRKFGYCFKDMPLTFTKKIHTNSNTCFDT
jgi:hypothetical protein